mmetsp:Transcript_7418/g.19399  ORF Transcript_7418/g.19399 Transcript_7418/m.19399 type:complete len:691 (-) Transcript_7418:54-2126(-)
MAATQHLPALLGSVGLGHLAPRLSQNEIDWETARLMKSADLADVGMTSQEAALFRAAVARSLGLFTRVNSSNMITPLGASEPVKMSTFARGVKGVDPGALVSYVTTRLGEASDVRPLAKVAPPPPKEEGRWRRGVTLAPEAPPVQKKAVPPPVPNAWGLVSKPAEPAPAPPANAWAAPPGLQPEPPKANAWSNGAPLSARTNSGSSSESIKFVGTAPPPQPVVPPRKTETADERAQTAMMLALRAWVAKQPQKKQLMSEVHHFWTAHPELTKPRERMTKVVERHAVAHGMKFRKLPAPDGGVLELEQKPVQNAWTAPREVTLDMKAPAPIAAPEIQLNMGRSPVLAPAPMPWNPLLDAVVGEAPARSVVGFMPERLGPSALNDGHDRLALQGDRLAFEQSAKNDEASQALIQKLLAEDRSTSQQRPPARKPRPKPRRTAGSAFDPPPTVESARRRVDAFLLKHPKVDKRGTAALRRLEPRKQVRLVRRLEADQHKSEVDGVLVLASIKDNNNFAATAQELQRLTDPLRPVADRLALSSDAVAKLATLSRDDQGRVATRFEEPGYLDDLRNVEGFVKCCFHDRGDPLRRLLRGRPMEPLLVKAVQDLELAPDCIAALRKLALRKQKDAAAAISALETCVASSTLLAALEDGSLLNGGLKERLARAQQSKWARPDSVVSSTSSSELSALGAW